jgi:hypothetical protein
MLIDVEARRVDPDRASAPDRRGLKALAQSPHQGDAVGQDRAHLVERQRRAALDREQDADVHRRRPLIGGQGRRVVGADALDQHGWPHDLSLVLRIRGEPLGGSRQPRPSDRHPR